MKKIINIVLLMSLIADVTFAGLGSINTTLSTISTAILGVGVTLITLAFMWVGYAVAFNGAGWMDVARVFIGAIIVAGAAALAALIFG